MEKSVQLRHGAAQGKRFCLGRGDKEGDAVKLRIASSHESRKKMEKTERKGEPSYAIPGKKGRRGRERRIKQKKKKKKLFLERQLDDKAQKDGWRAS